jgi:hypothetical protein
VDDIGVSDQPGTVSDGSRRRSALYVDLENTCWLYDPDRHQPPSAPAGPGAPGGPGGLGELRFRIARITDVPALTAVDYQIFFAELAAEIAEHGYDRVSTPRAVHERAVARGAKIGRPTVKFVLASLTTAGHPPTPGDSAAGLAAAYADIVLTLCRNARMELSDEEVRLIRRWLLPTGPTGPGVAA